MSSNERLTDAQRKMLRSRINQEILRRTRVPTRVTNELERETSGPDPWDTRAAPGHSNDDALDRAPIVYVRRHS
jgi:hypothetical protein